MAAHSAGLPAGFVLTTPGYHQWRELALFDAQNFGRDAWPAAVWEQEMLAGNRTYLAIRTEPSALRPVGRLVGLGGISHGPEAEVLTIAVSAQVRGRGIGTALLNHLLQIPRDHDADAVFLEVRSSDARAQRIYERAGFVRIGLRKNYYHGDDAIVMSLNLAKSLPRQSRDIDKNPLKRAETD